MRPFPLCPRLLLALLGAVPLHAQASRITLGTCPAADSILGPPLDEAAAPVTGQYSAGTDITKLQVFVGYMGGVAAYTNLAFAGHGPSQPVGLALGFTFEGPAATRRAVIRDSLPTTLSLADSLVLHLGVARPLSLVRTGSQPALTVNVMLSRAAFRSLVTSPVARFEWPGTTIDLKPRHLGALRALYRAAMCSPDGVPSTP